MQIACCVLTTICGRIASSSFVTAVVRVQGLGIAATNCHKRFIRKIATVAGSQQRWRLFANGNIQAALAIHTSSNETIWPIIHSPAAMTDKTISVSTVPKQLAFVTISNTLNECSRNPI